MEAVANLQNIDNKFHLANFGLRVRVGVRARGFDSEGRRSRSGPMRQHKTKQDKKTIQNKTRQEMSSDKETKT